jgi:hypothetical protein
MVTYTKNRQSAKDGLPLRIPDCVVEELAKDSSLSVIERALYLLAWAHDPATITELAGLAKVDRGTAADTCASLSKRGWMKVVKSKSGKRPAAMIPRSCQIVMAHDLEVEYDLVPLKGEFLANKRIDWSIRPDGYVRNAKPKFLENPQTKKRMEYDRYDPKNAYAGEYNGSQHYRESEKYTEEDVGQQQAHDLMKRSLSVQNGVTLMVFTWEDLRPGALEARLEVAVPHLKRGYVDRDGPYMKTLNRICDNYASKVEKAEKQAILAKKQQE